MPNDINPRAVIGGNEPPLTEQLIEETAEFTKRVKQLESNAEKATATNDETAQKATLLAGLMKDVLGEIDKAREDRKRPFLVAGRQVDAHFNGIAGLLATTDTKGKLVSGPLFKVLGLVDEYRRKKEAEAAAERRRLEEEARKQREAAEVAERAWLAAEERERQAAEAAARRIREAEEAARLATTKAAREKAQREAAEAEALRQREAAAAQKRQHEAALAALDADREAGRLERQAEATIAMPLMTPYGVSARRRTVWIADITDLNAALRHAITVDRAAIVAAVQQIFDRQVRAGVRELPGATVREDSGTSIRTR